MRERNGFSLVEIMVALIIFSLVVVGLVSVFVSASKHITHTRERMTSAQLGKFYLDPLQAYVRYDTWGSGTNELTVGSWTGAAQIINNRNFTEEHVVDLVTGTDLHRVISTIHWNE